MFNTGTTAATTAAATAVYINHLFTFCFSNCFPLPCSLLFFPPFLLVSLLDCMKNLHLMASFCTFTWAITPFICISTSPCKRACWNCNCCCICITMNIGIMDEDVTAAAALASYAAIDETSLAIDLTIDPLLSEREFFVFLIRQWRLRTF